MRPSLTRLVVSVALVISGAMMYAGGELAQIRTSTSDAQNCANTGIGFLVAGAFFCVLEYVFTLRQDRPGADRDTIA